MKARQSAERVVAVILLIVGAGLLVRFFEGLPIEGTSLAIDWRALWLGIQGGTLRYGSKMANTFSMTYGAATAPMSTSSRSADTCWLTETESGSDKPL